MNNRSNGKNPKYSQTLRLFGLTQLIKEPTRVTSNSASIIDHIVTNDCEKVCQSGCIDIGFSDHSIIFCTRKIVRGLFKGHRNVKLRSLKNYSEEGFVEKLKRTKLE